MFIYNSGYSRGCREEMAAHLRRQVLSLPHLLRLSSSEISGTRSLTTDAVVELKPGEIGMVSGIPQEHLRRKVHILEGDQYCDC